MSDGMVRHAPLCDRGVDSTAPCTCRLHRVTRVPLAGEKVQASILKVLEKSIERVKEGDIRKVLIVEMLDDGHSQTTWSAGGSVQETVGALEQLKFDLQHAAVEGEGEGATR